MLDSPDGDPVQTSSAIEGFKADIHKRWNEKTEDQKRRELVRILLCNLRSKSYYTILIKSMVWILEFEKKSFL